MLGHLLSHTKLKVQIGPERIGHMGINIATSVLTYLKAVFVYRPVSVI